MRPLGRLVRNRTKRLLRAYSFHRPTAAEARLSALRTLVERADPALFVSPDLTPHEFSVFSQNGEDGVVIEILNRIGAGQTPYFVEFGIESGHQGNCVLLADVFGWAGLFLEGDADGFAALSEKYAGSAVRTRRAQVTADNVNALFAEAGVPSEPAVVSIDIDGNDLYVWQALTDFSARLVVIEYNSGIGRPGPVAQPYRTDRAWDGTGAFGSSLEALEVVGGRLGYRLVHTDLAGVNAFFVREDLAERVGVARPPRRNQNFGLTGLTHPRSEPEGGWQQVT
ncbi:MAG: hypothetical protein ACR2K3_11165 [Nocardioides sp.]